MFGSGICCYAIFSIAAALLRGGDSCFTLVVYLLCCQYIFMFLWYVLQTSDSMLKVLP